MKARAANLGIPYIYADSTVLDAGGDGIVSFAGPNPGDVWYIERVMVRVRGAVVPTDFYMFETNAGLLGGVALQDSDLLTFSNQANAAEGDMNSPILVRGGFAVVGQFDSAAGNTGLTATCRLQVTIIPASAVN